LEGSNVYDIKDKNQVEGLGKEDETDSELKENSSQVNSRQK